MRRRHFTMLVGAAALAWPISSYAQTTPTKRLGVLMTIAENDAEAPLRIEALRSTLQKFGWIAGDNLEIDIRWGAGDPDRLRAFAAELVASKPHVIFAGASSALRALHRETRDIPIVFAQVADPVAAGFVASLARPGGNITGVANAQFGLATKWPELLKELSPTINHLGVMYDPENPAWTEWLKSIESASSSLGLTMESHAARDPAGAEHAIRSLTGRDSGLVVLTGPFVVANRALIIALAARYRVPAVYPFRMFVASGGLASYGIDNVDLYRQAGSYVDRVLNGEAPATLPVQQATRFHLIVNLSTARALGLTMPTPVLARADEVIE